MTGRSGRETAARLLGVALGLLAMLTAWRSIGWPAPGVSVALGLGAYLLARGGGQASPRGDAKE